MSTDFGPLYLTHFEEKFFAKLVLGSKRQHYRGKQQQDTHGGNVDSDVMPHSYYLSFFNYVLRK